MNKIGTTSLVCALAVLVFAGGPPDSVNGQQGNRQPPLQPGAVAIDTSRVFTFVQGTGLGHSHGMQAKLSSGNLVLGAPANAGRLIFDMRSFDADTPLARQAAGLDGKTAKWMRKQVNKEMHGAKILNSSEFPQATFDIMSAKPIGIAKETGLPLYELVGNFTLRDATQPINLRVVVEESDGWLHLWGRFSFKQSDYGIKPLSKGFGSIGVTDQVTVIGDLWIAPTAESIASIQRLQRRRYP